MRSPPNNRTVIFEILNKYFIDNNYENEIDILNSFHFPCFFNKGEIVEFKTICKYCSSNETEQIHEKSSTQFSASQMSQVYLYAIMTLIFMRIKKKIGQATLSCPNLITTRPHQLVFRHFFEVFKFLRNIFDESFA